MNSYSNIRGLTLIELLVSMAVGAVFIGLVYTAATEFIGKSDWMQAQSQRVQDVQLTMQVMSRDLVQLNHRPIRDEIGDRQLPALAAAANDDGLIMMTTGGWVNPTGQSRSELQRVEYEVIDNELVRTRWQVLDRTLSTVTQSHGLLKDVESLQWRFLDSDLDWQDQWPAPGLANQNHTFPRAVEMTIDLKDWGELVLLSEVVE
ncbi:MAG: type II secretion system minor pseudopilin GspJ [Gammaproteobacteria bacterium]|nr:type II secretion system minor pseudopilin GspJ [Gammaproteobacteria bacterium]